MMEGVSSEASSLAGHQELGSLIVFYDQNHISIEDDTSVSFSENVAARYAAYGWHTQIVDWRRQGGYTEDVDALLDAITTARQETGRPSMIVLNTIIGWPAPTKQNTGKAHGAALGSDEVAATKKLLGFDPGQSFAVEEPVLQHAREVADRGRAAHADWLDRYEAWRRANPGRAALLDRLQARAAAGELVQRAAELRARPKGHGDPQGKRRGPVRAGTRAAGAVGRISGPG